MSQHSSCWLARHQFFIKYCITEKEAFKREKIEFSVSAQALMISAFYKVINWLYGGKKQVALHRAIQIEFSLLFYFLFFLNHLDFFSSLRYCIRRKKNELAAQQSLYYCAFTSTNTRVGSPHMAKWIRTGHSSILLKLPMMNFTLAKKKKGLGVKIIFLNLSRTIPNILIIKEVFVFVFFQMTSL